MASLFLARWFVFYAFVLVAGVSLDFVMMMMVMMMMMMMIIIIIIYSSPFQVLLACPFLSQHKS